MSVRIYTNKFNILYLDIRYGNDERIRSSTKLKNTPENMKLLKKNIIPNLEVQILNGEYNPKSKQEVVPTTVKDYGYKSLKRHENDRREHINRTYVQHFESKIIPYFGDTLIKNISAIQLVDWQNELLEKLKASSVKKYRTVFNGILEDARKELINGKKMIVENPFRDVSIPKEKEIFLDGEDFDGYLGQINPFSFQEIENILNKTDGYMKNFIGIMSRTGIRPGELVSLRWNDVDFENEIIKVRKTRVQGKNGPPKKQASVRNIEMLFGVKEFFESQYNITGCLDGDIFLNSSEKPFYSHDIIAKKFKNLLKKNDKRYLYQLRHSFATMMISEGEDILWVSRMLGHKNSDITLKSYANAYDISRDKDTRKRRALFLSEGHTMGTPINVTYDKPLKIGEN